LNSISSLKYHPSYLLIYEIGDLNDDMAAKIAGHELKGLVHIWECRLPDLHFPLQCLIDYLGFRLVAMLLLPLKKDTLKVGTNDGGKTMNYNDKVS
jgi:hypothetical protein